MKTAQRDHIGDLCQSIVRKNPLQSSFLANSVEDILPGERLDLESYIAYGLDAGLTIEYLAECYDVIVKDTLREQLFFQRHGRYRYKSFSEVAESVYFDDRYMRQYMHGLALTAYLWPNHRSLHRYFVDRLPRNDEGRYLEVGPGHGMFMMTAMRRSSYTAFDGIDISPTSVDMTRKLLGSGHFGDFDHYEIFLQDFFAGDLPSKQYAAVVIGEVLEHVEDPVRFLARAREVAAPGAFIFITTPINAPAIDHIYLFEGIEQIEDLVRSARLVIQDRLLVPYPELTIEQSMAQRLPVNVAMVLTK